MAIAAVAAVAIQAYASYMEGVNASIQGIGIRAQDELLAEQYIKEGADETNYLERVSRARLGHNQAAAAGGNVDATQGSPLLVMADQLRQDKQNEATTLMNAQHKAMAARMAGEQGYLAGQAGEQAGAIRAGADILAGAAQYYGRRNSGGGGAFDDNWAAG